MEGETEGDGTTLSSRTSKRAHTRHSCTSVPLPQNPFLASLWIGSGLGWPERVLEVVVQLCHVDAHFKALDESVLTAPSVLSYILFTIPTLPLKQCIIVVVK